MKSNLDKIKEAYVEISYQKHMNAGLYLGSRGIEYDPLWTAKQQELFHIDRFNYIQMKALEEGLTPIFITLTLPSEYHQFKSEDGGHIPNPNWDGSTINAGYKKLLEIFKKLYSYNANQNGKTIRKTLRYSRVIEPHKDFTPHLHAIVYVEDAEEYRSKFDKLIEKEGLKQVDFEVLESAKHSLVYLLKYVAKAISGKNGLIDGWRKTNKIVMVRTSNMPFTQIEYRIFKSNVPYEPKYGNYYIQMEHELLAHRHIAKVDGDVLSTYRDRSDFIKKAMGNDEDDTLFHEVSVGNSVNPKYIVHTYICSQKIKDYVEVEFSDSTSEFVMSEYVMDYDDFWMEETPICLDEVDEYGNPIPILHSQFAFEDDNEDYVYYNNKTRISNILLHRQFSAVS